MASHSRAMLNIPCRSKLAGRSSSATLSKFCRHSSTQTEATESPISIPPESPRFIDIPRPPQVQPVPKLWNKGILPRPRDVHTRRSRKTSHEYLNRTAPEPTRQRKLGSLSAQGRESMERKQRAAILRRQNLREGLLELKTRQKRTNSRRDAESAAKQADFQRRVSAPDPDDVRYTATTALQIANEDAAALRRSNVQQRREEFRRKQEEKQEERRYALHELYMNAREFIIDKGGLEAKINEVFDAPFYRQVDGRSVWDEKGIPETVKWMLDAKNTGPGSKGQEPNDLVAISKERQQRMAEELTGGKV